MNTIDPRLTDNRIKSAPPRTFILDESQWDGDRLRAGWMERNADAHDSGESILDAAEQYSDETDARDLTDIHGYHQLVKTICITVCIGWWVFVIFAIGFMVGGRIA